MAFIVLVSDALVAAVALAVGVQVTGEKEKGKKGEPMKVSSGKATGAQEVKKEL